ncbi:MAG TPA: hypothetical protein VKA35_03885 [Solirubrobacterales bacterium]|nr:hypothetical protein [Solirubrobacterales bacterium]
MPGSAVFLTVGRTGSPGRAIREAGGSLVARLDPRKALAVAPLASWSTLRNHSDLQFAGPVSVDLDRLRQILGGSAQTLNQSRRN